MKRQFLIVGIAALLLSVALSGCTRINSTEQANDNSEIFGNQPPRIEECYYSYFDKENSSTVDFIGYAVDYDGEIVSYFWNLSDGTTSNMQIFTYTFQSSGTYYATLTVTDDSGATNSTTIEITVSQTTEDEDTEPEEWNPEYGINYMVTITNVIDGDTFDAVFLDGSEERIRLLGVDTPETTASENKENEYDDITDMYCLASYGLEAKDFAETSLEGETVYIQFDSTAGFKGYYGRWLAYVFLLDGIDFNEELIKKGYARVYTEGTCSKESYYTMLQNQAINDRVGLWSCMPEEEPPEEELMISYVHYDAEGNDWYNLNDEYVIIQNNEETEVELTGYILRDEVDHTYTFPDGFMLSSGVEVTVYTGSGVDTDTELYWGNGSPIWNNDHDTAYLKDDTNYLLDSYSW